MDNYFFAKLVFYVRQFFMGGMQITRNRQHTKWSIEKEDELMANVYVEIKVTWFFQTSPANYLFYADSKCDAFNTGRFTDSITSYAIVQAIGNESVTMSKIKADLIDKYRYDMAVPDVRRISRAEYLEAIERLSQECAA